MAIQLQAFSKTDWYGFAGAERFAGLEDNEPRMIYAEAQKDDENGFFGVADANGIEVYFDSSTDKPRSMFLRLDGTKAFILTVAAALPLEGPTKDATIAALYALGFEDY